MHGSVKAYSLKVGDSWELASQWNAFAFTASSDRNTAVRFWDNDTHVLLEVDGKTKKSLNLAPASTRVGVNKGDPQTALDVNGFVRADRLQVTGDWEIRVVPHFSAMGFNVTNALCVVHKRRVVHVFFGGTSIALPAGANITVDP